MYNILPKTLFVGKSLKYLPVCRSTNDTALEMLQQEIPPEGTVVICAEQTAGRGQMGNTWEAAPAENLTLSIILFPKIEISNNFLLNVFTTVSIAKTLQIYLPSTDIKIKWPNDLYVLDKKICGILIQNTIRYNLIHSSVLGIGININQVKFNEKKAISVRNITGKEILLKGFVENLLEQIEVQYMKSKNNPEELWKEYLQKLYGLEEIKRFKTKEQSFEGKICGVDRQGFLCVETDGQVKKFTFKEIEQL